MSIFDEIDFYVQVLGEHMYTTVILKKPCIQDSPNLAKRRSSTMQVTSIVDASCV